MNPVIVEDQDVFKQFGSEALAVLDRCFYLAGLPRPDIGISEERINQINVLLSRSLALEEIKAIRQILHDYKKGKVEGDDLIQEMAKAVGSNDAMISTILEKVFPEFKELKAEIPLKDAKKSHDIRLVLDAFQPLPSSNAPH